MEHMKFETPDMVTENIDKIAALFPSAITEMRGEDGEIKRGVNFEVLKQILSRDVVDGDECYEFTWVGKKAAMAEASRPITKTLRPVKADSRDWDTTENLYIEGDNLEVLKILQESYLGKVKMIYIDPPYNTGHDFIYNDSFQLSTDEYIEKSGYLDEDGKIYFSENSNSNPRFHSDWCSYLFKPLILSRNILSDDGVIFISIDDNEITNMRKLCDEIFGSANFINQVIWVRNSSGKTVSKQITVNIEYLLMYSRTTDYSLSPIFKPLAEATIKMYSKDDHDGRGKYRLYPLQKPSNPGPKTTYDYVDNSGKIWKCPAKGWRMKETKLRALENDGRLCKENGTLSEKAYWNERSSTGRLADTYWNDMPENSVGTKDFSVLFNNKVLFNNPKPVEYLLRMLKAQVLTDENAIVLDFFSGSATTAHAVMQLNAEDGGHRKFIMVQLPEKCDEASEAYKAGYKNICEIGKERIRRAGDKIQSEHPDAKLDTGFRVFRVDESNMEDIYYHPEELTQTMLGGMVSNIKPDRTDLDLLYACLLDWGVEISLSHTQAVIDGCTVHNVDNGALCACFDERVPLTVIDYMAKQQPLRAVFRDSSFAADDSKINVTEIFKNLSPDTKVKVI